VSMKLASLGLVVLMLFGTASAWCGAAKVRQPPTDCKEWWTSGTGSWEAATESTIKGCLAVGADLTARDDWGNTPLHFAAWHGSPESVKALLAAGADAKVRNVVGDTPLHVAATSRGPESVEVLLRAGADPSARNEDGRTPLHLAARDARLGALQALIAARAEVTARDKNGNTPLHQAAWDFGRLEAQDDRAELVKALLAAGANPNERGNWGRTPLFNAADSPTNTLGVRKRLSQVAPIRTCVMSSASCLSMRPRLAARSLGRLPPVPR
jgi:hypothetical protein